MSEKRWTAYRHARDYVYLKGHKPKVQVSMPLVNNNDGFINSLLALSQKSKGKGA